MVYDQAKNKMAHMTKGLGLGRGAANMVTDQARRNTKTLNLGPMTDQQKAAKMVVMTKGMGLGNGAASIVQNQAARNDRNRAHGNLTLDQAYDVSAEVLIRQGGKCWVTGTELVINGYADNLRSYSIDRLEDSRGYSVDNCRAVCVWVNLATGRATNPAQKSQLWRHLSQLPPLTTDSDAPDFSPQFTDRSNMLVYQTHGKCDKRTKDRIQTWLPFFDLPPIAPLSTLTDPEVRVLLGVDMEGTIGHNKGVPNKRTQMAYTPTPEEIARAQAAQEEQNRILQEEIDRRKAQEEKPKPAK